MNQPPHDVPVNTAGALAHWPLAAWIENWFRALLVALMVACVALALTELAHLVNPAWGGAYLVGLCTFAALEANASYRIIRSRMMSGDELTRFRLVEFALLFFLLKAARYAGYSPAALQADLAQWAQDLSTFLDGETFIGFVLVFIAWDGATQTYRDFERLGRLAGALPTDEGGGPRPTPLAGEEARWLSPGAEDDGGLDRIAERFLSGGLVLLLVAGVTRVGMRELLNVSHAPVTGLIANVLAYFVLGLALLGQARLNALRKEWQLQGVSVARDLPARWARYSLAFFALAALLAFVLPTGYAAAPLAMAGAVLQWVIWLIFVLLLILSLPFIWLASLLSGGRVGPVYWPSAPREAPPPVADAAPWWLQVSWTAIFWIVLAAVLLYVVRTYLRDRPELLRALKSLALLRALLALWRALRRLGGGALRGAHPPRAAQAEAPGHASGAFSRLGSLAPRERVLYYYLSLLRRAERQGLPRAPQQTPREYAGALQARVPEAERDMDVLTAAFVEARYSRHPIAPGDARRARDYWERLRAALQALKRGKRR